MGRNKIRDNQKSHCCLDPRVNENDGCFATLMYTVSAETKIYLFQIYTLNMSIHIHTWQKNRLVMCIDLYDKFVYDERLAGLRKGTRVMRDSECKIHLFHSAKRASWEKMEKRKNNERSNSHG